MIVGQIGVGRWGKNILTTLLSDQITIAHIAYGGSSETREWLAREHPAIPATADYADILLDGAIEAVCIATPIETHPHIVRDALTSGKHIFVEKPLSTSVEEIRELYALAEEKNKTLFTGYIYLFDAEFQALQKKLEDEKGIHIEMNWEKHGSFESTLIENLLVHELALAYTLIGDLALEHVGTNEPDIFDATFKGARGTAHIHIDRTKTEKQKQLTVQAAGETFEHNFTNENLLSLELKAFFEATKKGSTTNKKRQQIDESISFVLNSLKDFTHSSVL